MSTLCEAGSGGDGVHAEGRAAESLVPPRLRPELGPPCLLWWGCRSTPGHQWLPRLVCCCLTRRLFAGLPRNTIQRTHGCTRNILLPTTQTPHSVTPSPPNATLKWLHHEQHVAAREKARGCKSFRRYLRNCPPASVPCAFFQSSAKLPVDHARQTAKHFFTASLGGRTQTHMRDRHPKGPAGGKAPPFGFRGTQSSTPTTGSIYLASSLSSELVLLWASCLSC